MKIVTFAALAVVVGLAGTAPGQAGEANVAVAANFTAAAQEIAAAFKDHSGHSVRLSFGASGTLTTQITQGAPFDVFLSADSERPRQLVAAGQAVPESRFTYAIGSLVLWSRDPGVVQGEATLRKAAFARLAICNPGAAPYGAAAVETLRALGLYDKLQPRLVEGANIAQAFQFVDTGNAEVGFVALAQLAGSDRGSRWVVPQELYQPIRQDGVLLQKGAANPAATAFLAFLKAPEARAIIARYGYITDHN